MQTEALSTHNLGALLHLVLKLWPDCSYEEEYEHYETILTAENEICYLANDQGNYSGFIHLTLRTDYVEGAEASPVAYVEAIYVEPAYRHSGIGRKLLNIGADWAKQKGCSELASDAELTNTASIEFHKKSGFEEVNRIVCFLRKL